MAGEQEELIKIISRQAEELRSLRRHLMSLSGDGVKNIDYVNWLRKQISRLTGEELVTLEDMLQISEMMPKPYKHMEKKHMYEIIQILVNEIEQAKQASSIYREALSNIGSGEATNALKEGEEAWPLWNRRKY